MEDESYTKKIPLAVMLLATVGISNLVFAANELAPNDHSVEQFKNIIESEVDKEREEAQDLPNTLPTETDDSEMMTKAESIKYLKQHPTEFERILSALLVQANATELEELLPEYQTLTNYDPSVVDWGNAIILAKSGRLDEAVTLYRKINSQLPDVRVLRFQLAMALFYNRQYVAAKSEFESLRSGTDNEQDIKVINKYLDAINNKNRWNFNANLSFLDDDNIANAPKEGTKLVGNNGSVVTYNSPHEEGKGISYSMFGDKRWFNDQQLFASLGLGSYGRYYWDNDKFNDITAKFEAGVGFQNAMLEVEASPFYSKRWYGGGVSGSGDLNSYNETIGIDLSLSQWLSKKLMYQSLIRYSDIDYIDKYDYNDGQDKLFANTLIYFNNPSQNFSLGVDYSNKEAEDKSNAFDRKGMRFGWGQTWPKGFSTRLNFGYAERDYKEPNFFGIKRENEEINVGLEFWKRDFTLLGLTPRLNLDYQEVNSNSPFEEYDKTNVSVELTKSF